MFQVPDRLVKGPVHRRDVLAAGVSRDVLEGVQFTRLHESVYVHRDHEMTWADRLAAARLALPEGARTTGVTRLQELGIDVGTRRPLHFVVEGDLHLVLDGVFLHRTVKMPPHDESGVSIEAAFVAFCAEARLIDAIGLGCFLLNKHHLDGTLLERLLDAEPWRAGAREASYVGPFLDDRPRSIPEAELLAYVTFSGIAMPDVNQEVELADGTVLTPDLWFAAQQLAVEYEGGHHQDDRPQYLADIDRYSAYRRTSTAYEQVTKELMRSPRATVRRIHAALVARGYDGPPPDFDGLWLDLFRPLSELVGPRHRP